MDSDPNTKDKASLSTDSVDMFDSIPIVLTREEKIILTVWSSKVFRETYPKSRTIKQDKKNLAIFLNLKVKDVSKIIDGLYDKLSSN